MEIEGEVYNLSLDKKHIFRGWYVVISKSGEEYLVQRSFSISSKWFRNVYKVEYRLDEYLITEKSKALSFRKNKSLYLGLGLAIASILNVFIRKWLPFDFWFGHVNATFDFAKGIGSLFVMLAGIVLWVYGTIIYRRYILKKAFPGLKRIGKIKSLNALILLHNKKEFW